MKEKCMKVVATFVAFGALVASPPVEAQNQPVQLQPALENAQAKVKDGAQIFRFDTFGDEQFWGGKLKLHQAIAGSALGGVGTGLTPKAALDLGLKVDVEALPDALVQDLRAGKVDLSAPATTVALLKLNGVVGIKGVFSGDKLTSVGITCALCHSTVDNSLTFGIGRRLDGWANHDLDVGKVIALAPDLSRFVELLKSAPGNEKITQQDVRKVLSSWGPGKFDAELLLDGKTARPDGGPAATLIPNNFGLAGFNLHTWTGAWGSVPYWNSIVAVLEMGGIGTFFDPRLDDPAQFPDIAPRFPIAVANKLGHVSVDPDTDKVTGKLPALQVYQLALQAPQPQPGVDFNAEAAKRGDELFSGKAKCNNCHHEPLWTEPGWNAHRAQDIGIDSFQADRSPDKVYKTQNLAGLFIRENGKFMKSENKGRFYHDGRFKTLLDVVNHYNTFLNLALTANEKADLVEYLKSLSSP
ncbi:hypothetical protein [Geotalea sp. SG265]|uniref:hypothetical protein n=1 Tax=Geotalea sp. SG265 TaxID=2922867 RepID=UPI001FAEE3CD|nr:hypothetical protein [Geotalea sp. SG265]